MSTAHLIDLLIICAIWEDFCVPVFNRLIDWIA